MNNNIDAMTRMAVLISFVIFKALLFYTKVRQLSESLSYFLSASSRLMRWPLRNATTYAEGNPLVFASDNFWRAV